MLITAFFRTATPPSRRQERITFIWKITHLKSYLKEEWVNDVLTYTTDIRYIGTISTNVEVEANDTYISAKSSTYLYSTTPRLLPRHVFISFPPFSLPPLIHQRQSCQILVILRHTEVKGTYLPVKSFTHRIQHIHLISFLVNHVFIIFFPLLSPFILPPYVSEPAISALPSWLSKDHSDEQKLQTVCCMPLIIHMNHQ